MLEWYFDSYIEDKAGPESWNLEGFHLALKETFGLDVPLARPQGHGPRGDAGPDLAKAIHARYENKEAAIGAEQMLLYERMLMLQIVDTQWKDHLYSLDHLKEGIGLRGYGQRDPLVEYKKESFKMYQALMDRIDEESLRWIYLYQPVPAVEERPSEAGGAARAPGSTDGRTRRWLRSPAAPAPAHLPRPPRPPASASPSWPWPAHVPPVT